MANSADPDQLASESTLFVKAGHIWVQHQGTYDTAKYLPAHSMAVSIVTTLYH